MTTDSLDTLLSALSRCAPQLTPLAPVSRILACLGIWQQFDKLRSADAPFDRARFLHYLEQTTRWAETCPDRVGAGVPAIGSNSDDVEAYTGNLYAQCWVAYDNPEFVETTTFFERRLRNNGIGPEIVRGRRCLDAGCGGGRFTLAMHRMGAAHVVGVDVSADAVADGERRRASLDIFPEDVEFRACSLLEMPEHWGGRYDFVCSNGVLHHTVNPRKGLAEIHRVMKPEGQGYIYVYGAGGLHWALVDWIRVRLEGVDQMQVRNLLHLLDLPAGKIFHIMDHWFVPKFETLTRAAFEDRLLDVGFRDLTYLPRGLFLYDSSERRYRYPEDADLMGDGDLRYLVRK